MVPKESAMLIDRDGMPADFDIGVIGDEGQLKRIGDPADRANRIPNTYKPWVALGAGHRVLKRVRQVEILAYCRVVLAVAWARSIDRQHHADRIRNKRFIQRANEPIKCSSEQTARTVYAPLLKPNRKSLSPTQYSSIKKLYARETSSERP